MKLGALAPLLSTPQRRAVLIALSSAYMLVQLSSLPVALSLPTLAEHFNRGVDDAAWMVVLYLLTLGAFVMLGARLGDRYGHARVFFIGLVLSTLGSILIAASQSLLQVIIWRGLTGLGSALIMGNANAILAAAFPAEERGRAFSIPIVGARFGTLIGLALFALFLQYLSWRLVFLTFVPMGILAIAVSRPMLRMLKDEPRTNESPVDIPGGLLLVVVSVVFLLAGAHLHGGEESYTSDQGILYHGGMYALSLALLGVFILLERRMSNPLVDLQHFRHKYFSLSLVSNVTFHFSMLATMTLVPIIVELGYNKSPIWVPLVLLPNQIIGLVMTFTARLDIRQVPAQIAAPRRDGGHRVRLPLAGHLHWRRNRRRIVRWRLANPRRVHRRRRPTLVHPLADAPHILRHGVLQPGQQRHDYEFASAQTSRLRVRHAGDHPRTRTRARLHRIRHRAGNGAARQASPC